MATLILKHFAIVSHPCCVSKCSRCVPGGGQQGSCSDQPTQHTATSLFMSMQQLTFSYNLKIYRCSDVQKAVSGNFRRSSSRSEMKLKQ